MKKILTMAFALALSLTASAQGLVKAFADKVASSCVSFSYTYSTGDSVSLTGSGKAVVQDDSFRLEGEGMEVCCDGVSRWSADFSTKELIVENVFGEKDYAGNPALLVSSLEDAFTVVSSGMSKFHGKVCRAEALSPRAGATAGVQQVKAYFDAKGNILGVDVLTQGTPATIVISALRFTPKKPSGSFLFDTSVLDSSWVVTDLR